MPPACLSSLFDSLLSLPSLSLSLSPLVMFAEGVTGAGQIGGSQSPKPSLSPSLPLLGRISNCRNWQLHPKGRLRAYDTYLRPSRLESGGTRVRRRFCRHFFSRRKRILEDYFRGRPTRTRVDVASSAETTLNLKNRELIHYPFFGDRLC